MRTLHLAGLIVAFLPGGIACSSDKQPEGDIGYGASDGKGATGANDAGATGGTGNRPSPGGKGGKGPGKGGTGTSADGGATDVDPTADACTQAWSAPPAETDCDLDALPDSGITIGEMSGNYRTVSADTTLEPGKTYKLDGLTIIQPGVTLTINRCTKILGQGNTSVLITDSGIKDLGDGTWGAEPPGRLVAIGEADAPIVMTSSKAAGNRRPGDWGGVVICGKAPENVWRNIEGHLPPVAEGVIERPMNYGWQTNEYANEDNGTLKYVRLEYVGHDLGGSTETNGLTMYAVGSGTTISHVMVSNAIDDCFEWFGGTVNADHLIAFNCDDDGFDVDQGFSGKVQFGFSRQLPTSVETDSNGFEWDGSRAGFTNKPLTTTAFSNMTACGGHTGDFQVLPRFGAVMRAGIKGSLLNTLITGFDTAALSIRDDQTSYPSITYTSAFDNFSLYDVADAQNLAHTPDAAGWFPNQEANTTDAPTGFCDCWANPPQPFSVERIPGTAPGEGFVTPDADYRGAFEDASPESNWMAARWVDWAED